MGKSALWSPVQFLNAYPSSWTTEDGKKLMFGNEMHSRNASSPIESIPDGICTFLRLVQPEKTLGPMLISLLGIVTEVMVVFPKKVRYSP